MPEAIPIIIGIIGAAGVGTSIYSQVNQPSAPKATAPTVTPAEALKKKQGQIASLEGQFPEIQAATGGSLSPDAWIHLAELLSNQAGTPGIGAAEQDILKLLKGGSKISVGTGGGGTSGTSSGLTTGGTYA